MLVVTVIASIWFLLLLFLCFSQLQYLKSFKAEEPKLWQEAVGNGTGKFPIVYFSAKANGLLKQTNNQQLKALSSKQQRAKYLFTGYVLLVIVLSTVYFYA
ncbi:hypothetical protein [Thalassotalea agarivorans]|uniref:Uncharacterized protein n=1 Tax=Thalassotalea agarivorans TaxID=349064 RepID=A0A1I0AHD3_THASX|nr:hypothetical protein [Thalassotalea agarivorans]SES93709.1 hypothetical protein SAMN05660429_00708 [Thalassotalea agarivorans]